MGWATFACKHRHRVFLGSHKNHRTFAYSGEYAGLAIYRPRRLADLKMDLFPAIGKTVELEFVTVARPGERYAGQNIYRERGAGVWLARTFVPEADLEFLDYGSET